MRIELDLHAVTLARWPRQYPLKDYTLANAHKPALARKHKLAEIFTCSEHGQNNSFPWQIFKYSHYY